MSTHLETGAPVTRRVRAYFAPVDRATSTPTIFDPAQQGRFTLDAPPSPWIDLGWCTNFARSHSEKTSGITALRTGAAAMATAQTRTGVDATVTVEFATWGKLQLALSSGSQQMNLLAPMIGADGAASGGAATARVNLDPSSTATTLVVGAAAAQFSAGDLVVVDSDYTNQTGFIGAGLAGAYVRDPADIHDADYIRRVSLNVARIASIADGTLTLEHPLLAGAPAAGMKAARVLGFVDREGPSFFQEWSALFVLEGEQGDRVLFHYPRLQAMHNATEAASPLAGRLAQLRLAGAFRALPVIDPADGEPVLCFRSYLPA